MFDLIWVSGPAIYLLGFYLSRANKNAIVSITDQEVVEETGWKLKNIKNWKKTLKEGDYISVEDKGRSIITIANFRPLSSAKSFPIGRGKNLPYQKERIEQNLSPDLQKLALSDAITLNKQKGSLPLIKDIKEKKLEDHKKTANFILSKILNIQPGFKKPNIEDWANDVRLMIEIDKRTHEQIKSIFSWANNNNFWRSNILSPGKLRLKWDQLDIQRKSKSNDNKFKSQGELNSAYSGKTVI